MDFLNSIQKQILNDAQKVDGKDKESRRRWLILCIKKVFFSNLKTNLIWLLTLIRDQVSPNFINITAGEAVWDIRAEVRKVRFTLEEYQKITCKQLLNMLQRKGHWYFWEMSMREYHSILIFDKRQLVQNEYSIEATRKRVEKQELLRAKKWKAFLNRVAF